MSSKNDKNWFKYFVSRTVSISVAKLKFGKAKSNIRLGLDTPFYIVSNHQTDFDLAFMLSDIREQVRPVASEHVVRVKIGGALIRYFLRPITVTKGSVKVSSVREMLKASKEGANIMIHPEGTRTFDGVTLPFGNEIGKVVKKSGAALVTYRIEGGYLASPRWALNMRKGLVTGKIVDIYKADELKELSAEEITGIIRRDIHVDDYLVNETRKEKYIGNNLAEGIENYIFMCPSCGRIGTLKGIENSAVCECGFSSEIDEYGCFEGIGSVKEWGQLQRKALDEMKIEEMVFSDDHATLFIVESDHSLTNVAEGKLSGDSTGLYIGEYSFDYSTFEDGFDLISRGNSAYFTVDKVHYMLSGDKVNMYKYHLLFEKHNSDT